MNRIASADANTAQLNDDSPWPGLEAYREDSRGYFFGRAGEIDELLALVLDRPLTLLFGRAGLGKSSLLMAGLFPRLREKGFLPIYIRLLIDQNAAELLDQARRTFEQVLDEADIEYPSFKSGESLWQYLHRDGLELWTPDNRLVCPVFVFDQFEEIFTVGRRIPASVQRFRTELADLVENRIPASLVGRLEEATLQELGLAPQAMPYKVVLSLREDFLADLEGWRQWIPCLQRNRMRLLPMRAAHAEEAILNEHTSHLVTKHLAGEIVAFLGGRALSANRVVAASTIVDGTPEAEAAEIDPAFLSLFCTGVNERRKHAGKASFDDAMVQEAKKHVVADFYRECLEDLPATVRNFIEDKLITEHGFRNSFAVADALTQGYLDQGQLDLLVNRRLIRRDYYLGTARIELTHDLLTPAVMVNRDRRRESEREAEAARQRTRFGRLAAGAVLLCASIAVGASILIHSANDERNKALSRQFSTIARSELLHDPQRTTLLGLEALRRSDTLEAREALAEAATLTWPYSDLPRGTADLGGTPVAVAINTDGTQLAVLARQESGESVLSLWTIVDPRPAKLWMRTLAKAGAAHLAFSRRGDQLAVGGQNGLEIVELDYGDPVPYPNAERDPVRAMAYGRDGQIAWSTVKEVFVWPRTPLHPETIPIPNVGELGFDRTGRLIALASNPSTGKLVPYLLSRVREGTWRKHSLSVDCSSSESVSVGSGALSRTTLPATCFFEPGQNGSGKDSVGDTEVQREGVVDVVWARVGRARVLVQRDGRLAVIGPRREKHWVVHLSGAGVNPDDETLVDEISVSPSGLRLAVLSHTPISRVRVYRLNRRPFFADLARELVAVASDGSWIAVEQQRDWNSELSSVDVFALDSSGRMANVRTLVFGAPTSKLAAAGDGLLVTLSPWKEAEITQRFDDLRSQAQASWSIPGRIVELIGEKRELILLSEQGGADQRYRVIRASDGSLVEDLGGLAPPVVSVNERFVAVPREIAPGRRANLDLLRIDGAALTLVGKVRDVPLAAWSTVRVGLQGEALSNVLLGSTWRVEAVAAVGEVGNVASTGSALRISPTGRYRIEDVEGETNAKEVVYNDSGAGFGLPKMTERYGYRFSGEDRWLAFWDDHNVEVIDLEARRHVVKLYSRRQIGYATFEGNGGVLVLHLDDGEGARSMLVPLRRELAQGFAQSAVARPLTDRERCTYFEENCDVALLGSHHVLGGRGRGEDGFAGSFSAYVAALRKWVSRD